jgi:murein DD-endopeptidase MepM/ murein hydrolase activator NlpD
VHWVTSGRRLVGWALAAGVAVLAAQFGTVIVLMLLAVSSASPASACPVAVTESLSIMGPPLATAERVIQWWGNRADPPRLGITVRQLIDRYYAEGLAEGVRPELAFAQAALETGRFTSSDTAINNYAGIGHPDGAGSGFAFPSPTVGVRAHVQLLRAFAEGNEADFASARLSPRAGARATTLVELVGTWATDTSYAQKLVRILVVMTGVNPDEPGEAEPGSVSCQDITGAAVSADGYSLPVDRVWYDQYTRWFTKPHHDYPAADIPVPEATPVYAMVSGVVTAAPVGGRCGLGVSYQGDDGLSYVACHGSDGGLVVGPGDRISAGQVIMHSSWTGNVSPPGPGGTHLHQGVRRNGVQLCPQPMFRAIAEGRPVEIESLPSSGCVY